MGGTCGIRTSFLKFERMNCRWRAQAVLGEANKMVVAAMSVFGYAYI